MTRINISVISVISVGHKKIEDMKKTYINPELEVIKIKTQKSILIGSDPQDTPPDEYGAPEFEFDD